MTNPNSLLGVEAVAERLGLGRTLTRQLVTSGRIESLLIGRRRLVPSDAVDAFIEREREAQRAS